MKHLLVFWGLSNVGSDTIYATIRYLDASDSEVRQDVSFKMAKVR